MPHIYIPEVYISQDISEMSENILRLERILYEERTRGF